MDMDEIVMATDDLYKMQTMLEAAKFFCDYGKGEDKDIYYSYLADMEDIISEYDSFDSNGKRSAYNGFMIDFYEAVWWGKDR